MISVETITEQISDVLEQLQPYFLMHGGDITYDNGVVYVSLSGSCSGCSASEYTLKLLVEAELKREVPQVQKVVEV